MEVSIMQSFGFVGTDGRQVMQTPNVQAMLKLASLGRVAKRIAVELGCSRNTVRRYLRRGGWQPYRVLATASMPSAASGAWCRGLAPRIGKNQLISLGERVARLPRGPLPSPREAWPRRAPWLGSHHMQSPRAGVASRASCSHQEFGLPSHKKPTARVGFGRITAPGEPGPA